jgi:hypothetical protein
MFLGIVFMVLAIIGAVAFLLVSIWFIVTIGFLPTVTMYLCLMFITTIGRMYTRHKRHRIGFRTVNTWDTDAADEMGSTARFGIPHDPYSTNVYRPGRRAPRGE